MGSCKGIKGEINLVSEPKRGEGLKHVGPTGSFRGSKDQIMERDMWATVRKSDLILIHVKPLNGFKHEVNYSY